MLLANSLRTVAPYTTLKTISEYLNIAQISRLSNLTYLDEVALPVYSAIRPLAKSLTVSQGKGLSEEEAKISAYMEALEVYFAENVKPDYLQKTHTDHPLFINPNNLTENLYYPKNHLHNWCKVASLLTNQTYYIPHQFLSIDTTDCDVLLEGSDTTGLASGNNYEEALVHSLLECIERQSSDNKITYNVTGIENTIYARLSNFYHITVTYLTNRFNIPLFYCYLKSNYQTENQTIFHGAGCHFDSDIALNRALTEAYQAKLTVTSGARDDINHYAYNNQNTNALTQLIPNQTILFSKIKTIKFSSVDEIFTALKSTLQSEDTDALIYIYHQKDLTFLKSILIAKTKLANDG